MTQAAHLRYLHKPFIGSSHTWALDRCADTAPWTRVLDIGCGSGAIGKALKERGLKELSAVEVDPQAKVNALAIYNRVEGSLADFKDQRFDLIFILDVLEHLTNPDSFLKEAVTLLAPGGRMLISVPNVAHWSVRFQLLFGYFTYTERGILDKTHFQFFTRRRLLQLLGNQESLELKRIDASIAPLEFLLPDWAWNSTLYKSLSHARYFAAQAVPGLLAYQHLAEVRKKA